MRGAIDTAKCRPLRVRNFVLRGSGPANGGSRFSRTSGQHRRFRRLRPTPARAEFVIARHPFIAKQDRKTETTESEQQRETGSFRRALPAPQRGPERKEKHPHREGEIGGSW